MTVNSAYVPDDDGGPPQGHRREENQLNSYVLSAFFGLTAWAYA